METFDEHWAKNFVASFLDDKGNWRDATTIATRHIRGSAVKELSRDPQILHPGALAAVLIVLHERISPVGGMSDLWGIIAADEVGIWYAPLYGNNEGDDIEKPASQQCLIPWHNIQSLSLFHSNVESPQPRMRMLKG